MFPINLVRRPNNLIRRPIVRGGLQGPPGLGFRRVRMDPCGSYGAYLRHRKLDESPCRPCKDAARDYQRARAAVRKAAAGSEPVDTHPDGCPDGRTRP